MEAKHVVGAAVEATSQTSQGVFVSTEWALSVVLPILRTILSDMPWYKRIILSVKFLIRGIEGYLSDKGWDI